MRFLGIWILVMVAFLATGCGSKSVSADGSTSMNKTAGKDNAPQETRVENGKFDVYGEAPSGGKAPSGGEAPSGTSESSTDSSGTSDTATSATPAESSESSESSGVSSADSNANASADSNDSVASANEGADNTHEMSPAQHGDSGSNVSVDNLTTIYFNFDRYDIRDDMKEYIKANAQYIKDNEIKSVTLQGNTDEFGTDEYNMALGQKRALAVRDALVMQGLPKKMFKTISYGTHKPVCQEKNAECYAKNRRTDIVQGK